MILSKGKVKREKNLITHTTLAHSIENHDAIGVAVTNGKRLKVFKRLLDREKYQQEIEEFLYGIFDNLSGKRDYTMAVHLRMKTCGQNTIENAHPFVLDDGSALMHNGHSQEFSLSKKLSDTRLIAEMVKSLGEDERSEILERLTITSGRFIVVKPDGDFQIFSDGCRDYMGKTQYLEAFFSSTQVLENQENVKRHQRLNIETYTPHKIWCVDEKEDELEAFVSQKVKME